MFVNNTLYIFEPYNLQFVLYTVKYDILGSVLKPLSVSLIANQDCL